MKFFVDTANVNEIIELAESMVLLGIEFLGHYGIAV